MLDAKLPYFTGMYYKDVNPATIGAYETLWPIHPAPLFFNPGDYLMIISMSGHVGDSIPKIVFSDPLKKEPVLLMEALVKHLYGWLTS